nr:hypothetical protein [Gordonia desulfuricans]
MSAAALTLAVPAVAHADGTKDPRFGGPPTTSAPERTQHCNDSTESGHDGVTRTRHTLGRTGPTSFVLDYETENVPDKIDVIYQGKEIYTTGYVGDDVNEGTGSVRVNVPRGSDDFVDVLVHGGQNTNWSYTVKCPA